MNQSPQERPCRNNNGSRVKTTTVRSLNTLHDRPIHYQVESITLENMETRGLSNRCLHVFLVERPIRLGAGATNCGALLAIEEAKLDARQIRNSTHKPIESVDLSNKVPLAQASNGRIAGHRAHSIEPVGQEKRCGASTRSSRGCLTTGMSPANHNHVVVETCHRFVPESKADIPCEAIISQHRIARI